MRYLLTDGTSTNKVEYYIIDLFKIYLGVFPRDIPGANYIGIDFTLTNVKKDELLNTISQKVDTLVNKIIDRVGADYTIEVDPIEVVDEQTVQLTVNVNQVTEIVTIEV